MKILNISCTPVKTKVLTAQAKAKNINFSGIYDTANSLEFNQDKYIQDFSLSLEKNKDKLYRLLDCEQINVDGEIHTITEHLKNIFGDKISYKELELLHKTQNANAILSNGFDMKKINITEYGPGIYFSTNEGELTIYSGDTIKAKFEGNIANNKNLKNYNRINSQITNSIRKILNMKLEFSQKAMLEQEVLRKFVNEYTRNKIVNELKIDGASVGEWGYYVIFNPNCIKNIDMYSEC